MTTFDFTRVYNTIINQLALKKSGNSFHSGRSWSSQNVYRQKSDRFGWCHFHISNGNAGYGIPGGEWFVVEVDGGFLAEVSSRGSIRLAGQAEGQRMSEDEMIATIVTAYRAEGLRRGQAPRRRPKRLVKKLAKLAAVAG
jgi:hypothetical protein